jgi:hypothetical protein
LLVFKALPFDVFKLDLTDNFSKLEANRASNLSDVPFNELEFIHKSDFELVIELSEFERVAHTFEDNELLVSPLLVESVCNQFAYKFGVEVGRRELKLVEFISDLSCEVNFFGSLHCLEFASPFGLACNVVLDQLVGRDINHVVLDCQVGTSVVNTKSLFVVHQHDSGSKLSFKS